MDRQTVDIVSRQLGRFRGSMVPTDLLYACAFTSLMKDSSFECGM